LIKNLEKDYESINTFSINQTNSENILERILQKNEIENLNNSLNFLIGKASEIEFDKNESEEEEVKKNSKENLEKNLNIICLSDEENNELNSNKKILLSVIYTFLIKFKQA
jgi:hypothetical protein